MAIQKRQARRSRRLQVKFWHGGSKQPQAGFTTNVSLTGMYIATRHPLAPGTRLRVKLAARGRQVVMEAVSVHARRTPPSMQGIQQSGMGVRFLQIDELIAELVPEVATAGTGAASAASRGSPPEDGAFTVLYADRQQLGEAIERDMSSGGLFVPTESPAPISATITVGIAIVGQAEPPLRFRARVVQALDSSGPTGGSNLLSGMGVEILDLEHSLAAIRRLAEGE